MGINVVDKGLTSSEEFDINTWINWNIPKGQSSDFMALRNVMNSSMPDYQRRKRIVMFIKTLNRLGIPHDE